MTSSPLIAAIVAMSTNRVIGQNNTLPWSLPADLRHFKAITTGHCIVMGRKTFESIGKPLANRKNIIITRDPHYQVAGGQVCHSLPEAIDHAKQLNQSIFIIGGATIYEQSLNFIERLYITLIHQTFIGDTYFPAIDEQQWQLSQKETFSADESNPYSFSFLVLERIASKTP